MPRDGRIVIDPAKLRYWRNVRCVSREQLAELVHVSVDTIRSYEKGRRCPQEGTFRRLFINLGVGPEDLLFENGRYVPTPDPE